MTDQLAQLMQARKHKMKEMADKLRSWSEEKQRYRPASESWNGLQVIEHCIGSETGTLAYMMKKTSSGWEGIPLATDENRASGTKLNEALISDKQWKAPQVLKSPTGARDLESQLSYWKKFDAKFDEFIHSLDHKFYERQVFNHPFSGRLSLYQTVEFMGNHLAHHMHQLRRIEEAMD